jgi:hypothetical protein
MDKLRSAISQVVDCHTIAEALVETPIRALGHPFASVNCQEASSKPIRRLSHLIWASR